MEDPRRSLGHDAIDAQTLSRATGTSLLELLVFHRTWSPVPTRRAAATIEWLVEGCCMRRQPVTDNLVSQAHLRMGRSLTLQPKDSDDSITMRVARMLAELAESLQ